MADITEAELRAFHLLKMRGRGTRFEDLTPEQRRVWKLKAGQFIKGERQDSLVINGRRYLAEDAFGSIAVDTVDSHACSDPHVEANVAALRERSAAGLKKYGTDLTRSDLTPAQWLQHLLEELLDAANYARVLMSRQEQRNVSARPAVGGGDELTYRNFIGWRWRHKNNNTWTWLALAEGESRALCMRYLPAPNKDIIIEELFS